MMVHIVQFLGSKSISIPQLILLEARDSTGLQYAERESLRASSEGMKHSSFSSLFLPHRVRSQVYHGAFWKPRNGCTLFQALFLAGYLNESPPHVTDEGLTGNLSLQQVIRAP